MLKESKANAAKESTSTNTVAPETMSNNDAQEEADRINMFRLAAIGAKEGAAAGTSKAVGTDITNTTLCTTDGQDFKTVDKYTLYALMRAVIEGAERQQQSTCASFMLACDQPSSTSASRWWSMSNAFVLKPRNPRDMT